MPAASAIDPSPHDTEILQTILTIAQAAVSTQQRLAVLLGVSHSAISQWISGHRRPDTYAAILAARVACARQPAARDRLIGLVVSLLDVGPGHWVSDETLSEPDRSIPDRVLEVVGLGGSLAGEARIALSDQVLDPHERVRLLGLVDDQRRALDELASQLRASPAGVA